MPTFQEILNVTSEKELKKLGKKADVLNVVKTSLGFPIPNKTWTEFYESLVVLKEKGPAFFDKKITFEELININSEKELSKLGALNDLKKALNEMFGFSVPMAKGEKGFSALYARILDMKSKGIQVGSVHGTPKTESEPRPVVPATNDAEDLYFKSKADKYIYALIKLDEQYRASELGLVSDLFYNKNAAKKWRDAISKEIHPDVCAHPFAAKAHAELNELYESITKE